LRAYEHGRDTVPDLAKFGTWQAALPKQHPGDGLSIGIHERHGKRRPEQRERTALGAGWQKYDSPSRGQTPISNNQK
jgi:hypothetical protein